MCIKTKGLSIVVLLTAGLFTASAEGLYDVQTTTDLHSQYDPANYNTPVVGTDRENGKSDIYGFDLSSPATKTVSTYRQLFFLFFIYAIFAVVFTVIAARKAGKGSLDIKLQGDIKEFRRSTISFIFPVVIALSSVLLGFTWYFLFGFTWSFLFGLSIYSIFWQKRTSYILITDEKIIIFKGFSAKEPIPWSAIQDITIQKRSIDIVISTGWKTKIRLFLVDKRDRKDLIQVFEHHVKIVENNSKPTVPS